MESLDEISNYLTLAGVLLRNAITNYRNVQYDVNKEFKKTLKPYIVHFHASHSHPSCHSYDGRTDEKNYNDPLFKKSKSKCFETKFYPDDWFNPAEILIKEMSSEMDCDNNGLVFLKHFIFNPNDKNVPKIIHAMQRIELKNLVIPKFTWNDYLSTVSPYLYYA